MKEEIDKIIDKNKNSFSKKFYDLSQIEQVIDETFLKHNGDGNSNENQIKKSDIEKISLKSKDGHRIYYLKRKEKANKEKLNTKIIKIAETNLGKKPKKKKETKVKKKKINDIGSKTKTLTKEYDSISKNIDQIIELDSDDFIEVVNTKKLKSKYNRQPKRLIKKKTKLTRIEEKTQKANKSVSISELKAKEFAKQHIESNGKNTAKSKNIDRIPLPDDGKDQNSDLTTDDDHRLDNKIKEALVEEKTDTDSDKLSKHKKSFFKRKEKFEEKVNEKTDIAEQKLADYSIKNRFKVENLPDIKESKNEVDFIDKKLKEDNKNELNVDEEDETEKKAQDLVKNHTKEGQTLADPKLFNKEKTSLQDKDAKFDFSSMHSGENEPEHVFFDEQDSFEGWSPHVTESDRRKLSMPPSVKPEIYTESKELTTDIELPKEVLNVKSVKLSDLGFSENEWEELEFYPLQEPYAYVEILREKETLEKCYFLVEVSITKEEEEALDFIKETMRRLNFDTEEMELDGEGKYLTKAAEKIIKEYGLRLTKESKQKVLYYLRKSSLGLGKLDPLMRDPNIEDISCDGAGVPLFLYHRKYGSLRSNIKFNEEDELSSFIYRLAQKCGKHISIAEPMLDATMPDGSRIQMTLSDEITTKGSTFTIRKFKDDPFSPPDLFEYNTMSSEMIAYLWIAVENGINTLFAGGTASGKTTALNAISLFIPAESKIVSIEETREINLPHTNWIPGVARTGFGGGVVVDDKVQGEIDMYDLMKAALRQRPEYILVGEIRGKEAYVLFQAMATGHATYSTVHADSAQSLIHRLEGKPINIPRVMLQSLDVICLHIITKVKNNRARRCKQVVEIIDIDPTTKEILTNEVFRWDPIQDEFIYSGKSYILERIRSEKDLTREEMTNEIKNRQQVIEWMNANNIRQFREVANIVTRYAENPQDILKNIEPKDIKSIKNI